MKIWQSKEANATCGKEGYHRVRYAMYCWNIMHPR